MGHWPQAGVGGLRVDWEDETGWSHALLWVGRSKADIFVQVSGWPSSGAYALREDLCHYKKSG